MALHDAQELYDDLRRRTNEHLALAPTLSVDNVVLWETQSADPRGELQRNTHKAVVLIVHKFNVTAEQRLGHSPRRRRGPWRARLTSGKGEGLGRRKDV